MAKGILNRLVNMKQMEWEWKNLMGTGAGHFTKKRTPYYENDSLKQQVARQGYTAYRISPRKTIKFGKEYRKVYAAEVEPDYQRPVRGKPNRYYARITWHENGFVKATKRQKTGTTIVDDIRHYPIDQAQARRQLMVRGRR